MIETYLTKDQKLELDKKIDSRISSFPLLSRARDEALFHLLLYYEMRSAQVDRKSDLESKHIAVQRVYRGLNHSVDWVYQFCPIGSNKERPIFKDELLSEARTMFHNAEDYSELWVEMSKLFRGRNTCRKINENHYEFSPSSLHNEELDCTRGLIDHWNDPKTFEETLLITPEVIKKIYNRLFIQWNGKLKFKYRYTEKVFSYLINNLLQRSHQEWFMNPKWDLGGYTFEQVKEFWITLQAISLIHQIALNYVKIQTRRQTLSIQIRSFDNWIKEISERSNLSPETCALILKDLIYDEKLYHRPKKENSHVMYQPFFRLQNGDLAASNRIIQISNIERNTWSLASVIPKATINELRNEKEGVWINEIRQMVEPLGLKCFANLKYKLSPNKEGEIDLLIIDESIKFGLVCELKWLTYSDEASGVERNDQTILEKISQASGGVEWIKSNHAQLSQKIKIKMEELKEIDFRPIFILKESIASGFLEKTEVPVINQNLFNVVLGETLSLNIFSLWNIANSQSYLVKKNEHFKTILADTEWGDMRFSISYAEILKRWNPKTDIHL